MRKLFKKQSLFLAVVMSLIVAQSAWAGITSIEGPFDINGTMKSVRPCEGTADGFVILTDTGEETVYGLGPESYWLDLDVAFPVMDKYVEIEAYKVSYSDGTSKLIASSITLADEAVTVQLRDDDFVPLWTAKGKR